MGTDERLQHILAALGKGVANAMIAIGLVYTPISARIARGAVLSVRNEEDVKAARAVGAAAVPGTGSRAAAPARRSASLGPLKCGTFRTRRFMPRLMPS